MRDISKPPFTLQEIAAVFVGVKKTLDPQFNKSYIDYSRLPLIGQEVNKLALELKCYDTKATGDCGWSSVYLQKLIDFIIANNIKSKEELAINIDAELKQLAPNPFINYITGEEKATF